MIILINERFLPSPSLKKTVTVEVRVSLASEEDGRVKPTGEVRHVTAFITHDQMALSKFNILREERKKAILQAVSDLFDREFSEV